MKTFLYFNEEDGKALYTLSLTGSGFEPEGSKIEVSPDFIESLKGDLSGVYVIEGDEGLVAVRTDLSGRIGAAISQVNSHIGDIRSKFITTSPGQDMIYQAKENEAIIFISMEPEPEELTDFPFISAEVGILAPTAYQVASIWLNMSHYWRQVAADLEAIRIKATSAISEAATEEDINNAMNIFNSELGTFTA